MAGALGFVGIYAAVRTCATPAGAPASEILIVVTPEEVRVGGELAVKLEALTSAEVEARLTNRFSDLPTGSRLIVRGVRGVRFDTLQAVQRGALRAGLELPRLESFNPAGDHPRE